MSGTRNLPIRRALIPNRRGNQSQGESGVAARDSAVSQAPGVVRRTKERKARDARMQDAGAGQQRRAGVDACASEDQMQGRRGWEEEEGAKSKRVRRQLQSNTRPIHTERHNR